MVLVDVCDFRTTITNAAGPQVSIIISFTMVLLGNHPTSALSHANLFAFNSILFQWFSNISKTLRNSESEKWNQMWLQGPFGSVCTLPELQTVRDYLDVSI